MNKPVQLFVIKPVGTGLKCLLRILRDHAGGFRQPRQREFLEKPALILVGKTPELMQH